VVAQERGLAQPCAEVRRKGDAADVIVWQSATARLLPSHALVWDSVSTRACWLTISRPRASLFSQGREARSGSPASGQVARPGRAGSSPLQHSSPPQAGQHAGSPTVTTSSTRLGGRRRAWRRRPRPACARTAWGLAWVALGEQGCLRLATRRNASTTPRSRSSAFWSRSRSARSAAFSSSSRAPAQPVRVSQIPTDLHSGGHPQDETRRLQLPRLASRTRYLNAVPELFDRRRGRGRAWSTEFGSLSASESSSATHRRSSKASSPASSPSHG
jgi:hypothetical protein